MDVSYADLEREMCRIPEVTAARVVVDAEGRPTEVHVLASPDKHATQVARDIQSVAMASFGLDLDHRLISVVQLEDERTAATGAGPDAAAFDPPERATVERPQGSVAVRSGTVEADDRVVVDGVVTVRSGLTCTAEVILKRGTERAPGRAEGTLASSALPRVVAQATLDALRQVAPTAMRADVETATMVRLGDRVVALVTIVMLRPPYEEVMAGAAVVRAAGDHDAIARAVLHAVNRRVSQAI